MNIIMPQFLLDITKFTVWKLPEGLISIVIFSFLVTLLITFIYKWTTNQKELKELKERQKQLQGRMKECKDNPEKMTEINRESAQIAKKMLKNSFKPMLFTFIPILIIFYFLKEVYTQAGVGNIIAWGTNLPLIGDGAGWFLSYIVLGMVFSIIIRKVLKIH